MITIYLLLVWDAHQQKMARKKTKGDDWNEELRERRRLNETGHKAAGSQSISAYDPSTS